MDRLLKIDLGLLPTQTHGLGFGTPVGIDADPQFFGKEEPLFHHHPFFDDGDDHSVALVPNGWYFIDESADGNAVDGHMLARQQSLGGFVVLGDSYVDLGETGDDLAFVNP